MPSSTFFSADAAESPPNLGKNACGSVMRQPT
jgi:hypothetical protein